MYVTLTGTDPVIPGCNLPNKTKARKRYKKGRKVKVILITPYFFLSFFTPSRHFTPIFAVLLVTKLQVEGSPHHSLTCIMITTSLNKATIKYYQLPTKQNTRKRNPFSQLTLSHKWLATCFHHLLISILISLSFFLNAIKSKVIKAMKSDLIISSLLWVY